MWLSLLPSRVVRRTHLLLVLSVSTIVISLLWRARDLIHDTWTLATLPFIWGRHADSYYLSLEHDGFDVTFSNYSVHQTSADPYPNRVPPILHHISLGTGTTTHLRWAEARQSCLDMHPGWEAFMWTEEAADSLVAANFPELYDMWKSYPYPIQKIDALRYMVLYHYGGVILDMDLECKRGLGPLRRFEFVAPAAHPTGFSIGFMMASRNNAYIGELVNNLKRYNRRWLGLPYPTVMFSTGCHYASTIHSLHSNREDLKILAGTRENPKMNSLNGNVSTPLFNHLGSSSWHSYDAAMIVNLGKGIGSNVSLFGVAAVCVVFMAIRRTKRRWAASK